MDPTTRRTVGRTGVEVTQLGLGCAPLGEVSSRRTEEETLSTLRAAWEAGIRYFDTSPWYGRGLSELRTGAGLRDRQRDEYVLSSKVGRWLRAHVSPDRFDVSPWAGGLEFEVVFDYTYDGILRSYEQSQIRLGLQRYDLVVIHDLDHVNHQPEARLNAYVDQLAASGWRAICELKAAGLVRGVGVGINDVGLIPHFLELMDPDFFLVASAYTLLRQDTLEVEFPAAVSRGAALVVAPFQSGLLARGSAGGPLPRSAPPETLERVRRIDEVCARFKVPLAAAALQFPLGHPSVAAVIPGASTREHVERNVENFRHPIPADLWAELKHEGLVRSDAPTPT